MPALVRRFNYRNIELYSDTRGESIGVRLTNGDHKFVRWLGFIDVDDAKKLPQARPVKLVASRYSNADGFDWVDLKPGEHIQGCLVPEGVYAITVSNVRVVRCATTD